MSSNWVVLKFGGTSVSGRSQWQTICELVKQRLEQGKRVLLVCSAVSGVTSRLSGLANQPHGSGLESILETHQVLATELNLSSDDWLDSARQRMQACLHRLQQGEDHAAQADLLAVGEWLSTRIGAAWLGQYVPVDWLDIRKHLVVRHEPELSSVRQWLSASCESGADAEFLNVCTGLSSVVITQGFVAANKDGATVLLGRGGSDTSAALLAGRLGAEYVEIWTDVPGLFSADPRLVPEARLVQELEHSEALEMAAAGAKVIHPSCIRAAAETSTAIMIRDTGHPDMEGTRILSLAKRQVGIKTVTCQKDMLVLLLQKIDTRREVGFLAGVFEVFRQRGVSVDLVATSETTTTVALNRPANLLDDAMLEGLVHALQHLCTVELYPDCVCINLVGRGVRTALSRLRSSMNYFTDRPLLMLSQSANDLCLSLLMPAGDHEMLVQHLHREMIETHPQGADVQFGPSWKDLQRWE